jgi:putative ABC transport system ATP-binding protein
VFQGFNLVPVMSVFDNVDYPLFIANVPVAERRSA